MLGKQEYQDPHIRYPHDDLSLNFSDYILQCRQIITDHISEFNALKKINANSPFELMPTHTDSKRYGALLIHGLFDSPFAMKEIGESLHAQGLLVRSVLLPGHGTVPGSLLNVTYEDWLQTVRYGIETFKNEVDGLFIVGFSIGSALAIYETLRSPSPFFTGLISLTPALKIKSKLAFVSDWVRYINKTNDRLKWLRVTEEIDYTRYLSIPFNAVYQCYELMKKIHVADRKQPLSLPQFFAVTLNDKTVSAQASLDYFSDHPNENNRLILYTPSGFSSTDPRITIRNSAHPEQRILDLSHLAMPFSPHNAHYGKNGDYSLASHSDGAYEYDEITPMEKFFYDSLFKLKLARFPRRRLTYNPDFEFLIAEIIKFIVRC